VDISQTRLDLAKAKQRLNDTKRAVPYCIQAELNAKSDVDNLEGGLKYAEEVLKDRF
jgi:rRNA-processing protein FCF1